MCRRSVQDVDRVPSTMFTKLCFDIFPNARIIYCKANGIENGILYRYIWIYIHTVCISAYTYLNISKMNYGKYAIKIFLYYTHQGIQEPFR